MSGMFSDLLLKAQEQTEKQRLLFLFAKTDETNKSRKREDKKGSIEPKMVVDKLPDELSEFSDSFQQKHLENSIIKKERGGPFGNRPFLHVDASQSIRRLLHQARSGRVYQMPAAAVCLAPFQMAPADPTL